MKKIQLLGFESRDLTVRESLHLTREYLGNGVLNVVYYLSDESLIAAKDFNEIGQCMQESDITIPVSLSILHMAGITSKSRETETTRNLYLKGLLRLLSRGHKKTYLITDSAARLEELTSVLKMLQPDLEVAGSVVLNESIRGEDAVNEINGIIPDAVILLLASPERERFVLEQKSKINARLLLSASDEIVHVREDGTLKPGGMRDWIRNRIFRRLAGNVGGGTQ